MRFQQIQRPAIGLRATASSPADAPAVIQVTGDPGRQYRVRLPRFIEVGPDGGLIETLKVWSRNTGDISETRTARISVEGDDVLTISGRLVTPGPGKAPTLAVIPVSLDYD